MQEFDILSKFSTEDYKKFRSIIIECILQTDMTKHNDILKQLQSLHEKNELDIKKKDKNLMLGIMLHAADISNPIKVWEVCH